MSKSYFDRNYSTSNMESKECFSRNIINFFLDIHRLNNLMINNLLKTNRTRVLNYK